MENRTRQEAVTFRRPFTPKGWTEAQPAGRYAVETEEALIESLSFPAWRRVSTTLTLSDAGLLRQAIPIDPAELTALLAADGADH
jgi:hypothetical protein